LAKNPELEGLKVGKDYEVISENATRRDPRSIVENCRSPKDSP
jgi:hypothetical protein